MRHLNPDELIDLADGAGREELAGHLAACDRCRRQVAELGGTMAAAREVDVPEPSPLFWEHLSARVRDRVAAEPPLQPSWLERWMSWRLAIAAAACAAMLGAAVLSWRGGTAPPSVTATDASVPAAETLPVAATEPVSATEIVSLADDPSLSLMANLASDLDWEDAAAAGLTARDGVVDRAIAELTVDEQRELRRLLTQELSGSGA